MLGGIPLFEEEKGKESERGGWEVREGERKMLSIMYRHLRYGYQEKVDCFFPVQFDVEVFFFSLFLFYFYFIFILFLFYFYFIFILFLFFFLFFPFFFKFSFLSSLPSKAF